MFSDEFEENMKRMIEKIMNNYLQSISIKESIPDKILTLNEAATLLCMSPHTLRRYAKFKKIPTIASSLKGKRFLQSDLQKWMKDVQRH